MLDDVGVGEQAGDFGLFDQHFNEVFVFRKLGQDSFEREQPLKATQTLHAGLVDLSHTARRDAANDLVFTEGVIFDDVAQ